MTAIALHPDRNFKYWLVAPAIFLLLLIGLFPLIYSLIVSFMRIDMMDTDTSFAGLYNYKNLFKDSPPLVVAGAYAADHRHRAAARTAARPCHGLSVPREDAGPADLHFAAGAAHHHLAHRGGRHMAAAVRQQVWPHQPDRQLVRGRARRCAVDDQSVAGLSRHHLLRDLAVDALHVPDPAGGPLQRRQVADGSRRDRRGVASSAPSATSCCPPSGRSWRSPS